MADALLASDLGGACRRPVLEALRGFERDMCVRSGVKVLASRAAARLLHGPQALAHGNVTRASAAAAEPV